MNGSAEIPLFRRLADVVRSALDGVSSDAFTITTQSSESELGRRHFLQLNPRSQLAASVSLVVPERTHYIVVQIGRDTRFELPVDGPSELRGESVDVELGDLVRAAATGHFRESLLTEGDVVYESRGVIRLGDEEFTSSSTGGRGPAGPRARWVELRYGPYG